MPLCGSDIAQETVCGNDHWSDWSIFVYVFFFIIIILFSLTAALAVFSAARQIIGFDMNALGVKCCL